MNASQTLLPELVFTNGRFQPGGLVVDAGRIATITDADQSEGAIRLPNRALLPGLINAHSHAFQRVIRGRTEYRSENSTDSFWTWRETMYRAAMMLSPEDVYDASRMAFLEMVLSGITAVGEFHYLHHSPEGTPFDNPNLLALEVVRAAKDVGIRIALLRVAYVRSGFGVDPNPRQIRFLEPNPDVYLRNVEALAAELQSSGGMAWAGVAPHSVRAVPLPYLKAIIQFGKLRQMPIHMHVAEQPAEVNACYQEYARSPVELLETEGLLSDRFTAVHAIHITNEAAKSLGNAGAIVCACPTTERNLGDGVVPVDLYFKEGVRVSLGSDSHVQIDLLEDARQLEYNLRLQKLERVILASEGPSLLSQRLFECATTNGAGSIGLDGGTLEPGKPADFFTVDLNDPSVAGSATEDLLTTLVFSGTKSAVRDVVIDGKFVVREGRHEQEEEIIDRFNRLQKKLWG